MSSGERKKRLLPQGAKGWEEAGGEFYQESYPGAESDLEMMQSDPHRISTLLPSKKNRSGTMKRDVKLATIRHRTTIRSHYQTTVAPNNDIQISLLPDLSENLSNERLLWEEIMKIKAMPVNMAQKKELKANLMSRDTLRLQGFNKFKWKKKKSLMRVKTRLAELNEKLTLWRGSLKKIEGYYGTGVVSFFLFVKWLIFLNIVLSFIMFVFVIWPTVYAKNESRRAVVDGAPGNDTNTSTVSGDSLLVESVTGKLLDRLFSHDLMVSSPLYYSYYSTDFSLDLYYFKFDLPLAYIMATVLCLSYSFICVVKNAACGFKHRLLESQGQFYVYCNLVFSGWDYCIQNERSAKIKHKALYNEIVGRLNVEKRETERRSRTKQEWCKLCIVRIFANVAVVILLAVAGYIIFCAFAASSSSHSYLSGGGTENWYVKVLREFSPAGCIIFFNLVLPFIFRWLATFERFSPIFSIQVTIFRTILLRFSSLCVLLGSVYEMKIRTTTPHSQQRQDGELPSWESYVARELYKLLILSVITQILYTFFFNFPRSLLAQHCSNKFVQYVGKQEFNVSSHVLDVVYIQTIIWLGSFYAPLLPAFGVLIISIIFYVKKFACLVNCKPASDVYYASRSHSLYMFILLISFAFSVVPWAYSLVEMQPSQQHGPFTKYNKAWAVVTTTFDQFPSWVNQTIAFCRSSTFVVPLLVLLLLTNYYFYAVYVVNQQMVLVLKRQLILEGHDKQFLLNRLSAFIKQQQERYRPNQAPDCIG